MGSEVAWGKGNIGVESGDWSITGSFVLFFGADFVLGFFGGEASSKSSSSSPESSIIRSPGGAIGRLCLVALDDSLARSATPNENPSTSAEGGISLEEEKARLLLVGGPDNGSVMSWSAVGLGFLGGCLGLGLVGALGPALDDGIVSVVV